MVPRPAPVLRQLVLMKLGPGEDEAKLEPTEVALDHFEIVDPDLGYAVWVPRMEVREAVILEEHANGDPEETADRGHAAMSGPRDRFAPQSPLTICRSPRSPAHR